MRGPRALLAVGAVALVPLALPSWTGLAGGPAPMSGRVVSSMPTGQVLVLDGSARPGQLVIQEDPTAAPVAVSRPAPSLGGPAEVTLAVSGLLVLAGAATSACAGGRRVRVRVA